MHGIRIWRRTLANGYDSYPEGSRYDGYFERVAERISAVLTDEMRLAILKLKYETPDTENYGSGVLSSCDSGWCT